MLLGVGEPLGPDQIACVDVEMMKDYCVAIVTATSTTAFDLENSTIQQPAVHGTLAPQFFIHRRS